MIQTAILRILIDLIKADAVIDSNEMKSFVKLKDNYHISNSHKKKAHGMTMAEAICELKGNDFTQKQRQQFIDELKSMTLVDGFCVKKEALILTAIDYCLSESTKDRTEIISINVSDIAIAEDQVVYIETESNPAFHKEITQNYRHLNTEFKCAGLNFFYIPKVAAHYRETDTNLFLNICEFLAPGFNDDELNQMVSYISDVSTKKFCKEQLFGKLGMNSLYNTKPGLLIHIGTSFVNNKLFNNFLKIEFAENESITKQMTEYLDLYTRNLSYDVVVIPRMDESGGHFLYGGFYKFVYDLYLFKNPESSRLLIDTLRSSLYLPDIGRDFEVRVSRKEKALYLLILLESANGGISFSATDNFREDERRRKIIANRFKAMYLMMGGRPDSIPDINDETIRRPALSHLNKFFEDCNQIIINHNDYKIKRKKSGEYYIPLSPDLLWACTPDHHEPIPFRDSDLAQKLD